MKFNRTIVLLINITLSKNHENAQKISFNELVVFDSQNFTRFVKAITKTYFIKKFRENFPQTFFYHKCFTQ
jgi:hypothetical protein